MAKLREIPEVCVIKEGCGEVEGKAEEEEEAEEGGEAGGLGGGLLRVTLDEEAQAFYLNLHIDGAESLPGGRIDAYVVVVDMNGRKHRTPTIKHQKDPKWNYNVTLQQSFYTFSIF